MLDRAAVRLGLVLGLGQFLGGSVFFQSDLWKATQRSVFDDTCAELRMAYVEERHVDRSVCVYAGFEGLVPVEFNKSGADLAIRLVERQCPGEKPQSMKICC